LTKRPVAIRAASAQCCLARIPLLLATVVAARQLTAVALLCCCLPQPAATASQQAAGLAVHSWLSVVSTATAPSTASPPSVEVGRPPRMLHDQLLVGAPCCLPGSSGGGRRSMLRRSDTSSRCRLWSERSDKHSETRSGTNNSTRGLYGANDLPTIITLGSSCPTTIRGTDASTDICHFGLPPEMHWVPRAYMIPKSHTWNSFTSKCE
jgi:hypothetical protein